MKCRTMCWSHILTWRTWTACLKIPPWWQHHSHGSCRDWPRPCSCRERWACPRGWAAPCWGPSIQTRRDTSLLPTGDHNIDRGSVRALEIYRILSYVNIKRKILGFVLCIVGVICWDGGCCAQNWAVRGRLTGSLVWAVWDRSAPSHPWPPGQVKPVSGIWQGTGRQDGAGKQSLRHYNSCHEPLNWNELSNDVVGFDHFDLDGRSLSLISHYSENLFCLWSNFEMTWRHSLWYFTMVYDIDRGNDALYWSEWLLDYWGLNLVSFVVPPFSFYPKALI